MGETDWPAMKTEYATTDISLRQLARKYGLSPRNVADHSRHDGWTAARKKYRSDVATKALKKAAARESEKLAKLLVASDRTIDELTRTLEDPQQFQRHLVEHRDDDGAQWTEEEIFEKRDTKAMRDIVAMLKDLTAVVRNLEGIPTQAEAEAQRVAAERLRMEQQKAAAAEETGGIEVVFSAGEEAWNE